MGRAPQKDLPVNPLGGRRRNPILDHSGRAGSEKREGRSKKEGEVLATAENVGDVMK